MEIEVIAPEQLNPEHLEFWRRLQKDHYFYGSPYFCPEFIQAVSSVRNDVYVSIIKDKGNLKGFFPFQRNRLGIGQPVAGPLSDFHGAIVENDYQWEAEELLNKSKLAGWKFHYLLGNQTPFQPYHFRKADSHYIDLRDGFDGYEKERKALGSKLIKKTRKKIRKLEREVGPVRFEAMSADPEILTILMKWKSAQYNESGLIDRFSVNWTCNLLREIHRKRSETFSGMLSALYAGDNLIALHMGMRSKKVWNWWFPRHDSTFDRYSPGIILRIKAAMAAPELGVTRIDLGKGDDTTYKPQLSSGTIEVAEGKIEVAAWLNCFSSFRNKAEDFARLSMIAPLAKFPGKIYCKIERQLTNR